MIICSKHKLNEEINYLRTYIIQLHIEYLVQFSVKPDIDNVKLSFIQYITLFEFPEDILDILFHWKSKSFRIW